MRASKELLTILAKGKGIDTRLFESKEEWELCDETLVGRLTKADIERLEAKRQESA